MPRTNAAFSSVEIDARVKARGCDAQSQAEAVFHCLLSPFSGDLAVEHAMERTAVA